MRPGQPGDVTAGVATGTTTGRSSGTTPEPVPGFLPQPRSPSAVDSGPTNQDVGRTLSTPGEPAAKKACTTVDGSGDARGLKVTVRVEW